MNKYEGIIFDLDGVVCHTDNYHYQAWKTVADELGIYFDQEINNRLRGVSRMESLEIILERCGRTIEESEKVCYADKKNEIYKKLLENMNSQDLAEEVRDTLSRLKELGVRMAIGSSSKNARFILERLGLEYFFDAVSDGTNIVNSKPNPEVFLKAAEYLKLKPAQCLVVEDAEAGLLAAIAGGMDCAAIGDALKSELPNYKLNTFLDLLKVI